MPLRSRSITEKPCLNIPLRTLVRRDKLLTTGRALLTWLATLLIAAGCGDKEIHLTGTTEEAKKYTSSALDAWKSGKKPDAIAGDSPALRMLDEDWEAGKALKSYQIVESPIQQGGHWRVRVTITVAVEGESEVQKSVAYAVTTTPSVSIIRADDVEFE